jgi:hypothetical protein
MINRIPAAPWLLCALLLGACGGGGGSSGSSGGPPPPANTLAVVVDQGPAGLLAVNRIAVNTLYATVTLCTPGSTTACQQIDHVQVDTGSVGLMIMAEVLNGMAAPQALSDPVSGNQLRECVQFADGYTWGSMVLADVQIAGRTLARLPVHLIGDSAAGAAPASCVSGPAESTVATFGANGVLGIQNFLNDCPACVTTAVPAAYYICPNNVCIATKVALADQVQNPVAAFASDNNGVVISLPAVTAPGAVSVSGTIYFGIGTQSNNGLGAAQLLTLDGFGQLLTTYGGVTTGGSVIDSGSNGYFFILLPGGVDAGGCDDPGPERRHETRQLHGRQHRPAAQSQRDGLPDSRRPQFGTGRHVRQLRLGTAVLLRPEGVRAVRERRDRRHERAGGRVLANRVATRFVARR